MFYYINKLQLMELAKNYMSCDTRIYLKNGAQFRRTCVYYSKILSIQ